MKTTVVFCWRIRKGYLFIRNITFRQITAIDELFLGYFVALKFVYIQFKFSKYGESNKTAPIREIGPKI